MAGLKQAFLLTILKSVCGLTGVLVGMFLAQKFLGRRAMMLIGHGLPAALMLGIGVADTVASKSDGAGRAIVACLFLYYGFYQGFSGALSWPIASELVSSRLRVITIGTGTGINYVFACRLSPTIPNHARPGVDSDSFQGWCPSRPLTSSTRRTWTGAPSMPTSGLAPISSPLVGRLPPSGQVPRNCP